MKRWLLIGCWLATGCHRNHGDSLGLLREPTVYNVLIGGQSNAVWLYQYGLSSFKAPYTLFKFTSCAVGATNSTQWLPGQPLYQACIDQAKNKRINLIIWVQGEAEAQSPQPAGHDWDMYFTQTVAGLRHDLGVPNLPVLFARLSDGCQYGPSWPIVYDVQSHITTPNVTMVSLDGLHCDPTNYPHYTFDDYPKLGDRFLTTIRGLDS